MLKANVQDLLSRLVVDRSTGFLHCELQGRTLRIGFAHGKIVRVVSNLGFHSSAAALAQSGHLTWTHFDALWARGEADDRQPVALDEMGISAAESRIALDKLLCRQALLLADRSSFEAEPLEGDERFPTEPFLSSLGIHFSRTPPPVLSAAISQQALVLMIEGEASLRKRDFKAAEEAFSKAHALDGSGAALGAQAWAMYIDPTRKAEQPTAKAMMQRALEIDGDSDTSHYRMGVMLRLEGHFDLAEQHFREAVRVNAAHLEAAQELQTFEARRKSQSNLSSSLAQT